MINSKGPNIDPCGTPVDIVFKADTSNIEENCSDHNDKIPTVLSKIFRLFNLPHSKLISFTVIFVLFVP